MGPFIFPHSGDAVIEVLMAQTPLPKNDREAIERVLAWLFVDAEDARPLISEGFVHDLGEPGKETGILAVVALREELSKAFVVLGQSRSAGRGHVISRLRFFPKPANFDPEKPYRVTGRPSFSSVWLWRLEAGLVTGLSIYREKVEVNPLNHWLGIIFKLRAAVIIVVFFWFAAMSDQALEVFRMAAGSPGDSISYSLLLDTLGWPLYFDLAIGSFCALALSLSATHPLYPARNRSGRLWDPPVRSRQIALSLVFAAQPSRAVASALWFASKSVSDRAIVNEMYLYACLQALVAVSLTIVGVAYLAAQDVPVPSKRTRTIAFTLLVVTLLTTFMCQLFTESGWGIAPAVIAARLSIMLCILGVITFLADRTRVPFSAALVTALLVFSFFAWDDHHVVRTRDSVFKPELIDTTFEHWLLKRHTESASDYPVVLVTSEGGGIRAAIMTAMVLDELRARNETFPEHLFAIVGVSGGSVGAVGYATALYQGQPPGRIADLATNPGTTSWQASFNSDLLSPTIRSLLGYDLLARFVPRDLFALEGSDRARALEDAWSHNWKTVTGKDMSALNFENIRPSPSSNQPTLLLLTTSTITGERMAISHVRFHDTSCLLPFEAGQKCADPGRPAVRTLADEVPDIDLPLATAAFMSARFPFISPPARLPGCGPARRYVDGGYYENSGVSTILDIVQALRPSTIKRARLLIVRIENGGADEISDQDKEHERFTDIGPPFDGLYNTRNGHGSAAVAALDQQIASSADCASDSPCLYIRSAIFRLSPSKIPLPLGWFISGPARAEIARQLLQKDNQNAFDAVGKFIQPLAKKTPDVPMR